MKLHLGCGSIYLKGYINIDGYVDVFATNCDKERLEKHSTTFDKYYKYDFCEGPTGTVADLKEDFTNLGGLPFQNKTIDEVVMIQVLEHLPEYKRKDVLLEIYRVLKPSGIFIVGVPDIKETARLFVIAPEKEDEWYIRLIYGTQRNQFSHHFCGYTPKILENLLREIGFTSFEKMNNINFYPAIYLKAVK